MVHFESPYREILVGCLLSLGRRAVMALASKSRPLSSVLGMDSLRLEEDCWCGHRPLGPGPIDSLGPGVTGPTPYSEHLVAPPLLLWTE